MADLTEEEILRRRDAALKRALNTPHKPHKPTSSAQKKTADSKRESRERRSAKSD